MSTQLETVLQSALADRQLLSHPFYQRWEAGGLSRSELTRYAEQYRFFEAMLPEFLESLSAQLGEGVARDCVEANLADEVSAPSHLSLFEKFADALDAANPPISLAMAHLVASYHQLLTQGVDASLAGLWAYEGQGAGIADSKAKGLAEHYGIEGEGLDFWTAHGSIEEHHASWTLEGLASLEPNLEDVRRGAGLIAEAWWSFLDERELLAV
jgi:pyrroloquinoline-quinone synthase